jgi:putative oxidoreductase
MWQTFQKYLVVFCRYYLGGFNLFSGLNYFVLFWPMPKMGAQNGLDFVAAATELNIFAYAKVVEMVCGACLVFNRFVPLALTLLMPVTVMIVAANVPWVPLPHVQMSVLRNLAMHLILLAAYANYFYPLLKFRAAPQPVWGDPSRITRAL